MAHRGNSRHRTTSVTFGVKRTWIVRAFARCLAMLRRPTPSGAAVISPAILSAFSFPRAG